MSKGKISEFSRAVVVRYEVIRCRRAADCGHRIFVPAPSAARLAALPCCIDHYRTKVPEHAVSKSVFVALTWSRWSIPNGYVSMHYLNTR